MNKHIILKSLYKPKLYLGCERNPFLIIFFVGGLVAFLAPDLWQKVIVGVLAIISLGIVAFINSKEPRFFAMLARSRKYQKKYLAIPKYPSKPYRVNNLKDLSEFK